MKMKLNKYLKIFLSVMSIMFFWMVLMVMLSSGNVWLMLVSLFIGVPALVTYCLFLFTKWN